MTKSNWKKHELQNIVPTALFILLALVLATAALRLVSFSWFGIVSVVIGSFIGGYIFQKLSKNREAKNRKDG